MDDSKPSTSIQGELIDLLPLNSKYIKLYVKWVNDPKVRIYTRSILPQTVEEMKKFLENQEKGGGNSYCGFLLGCRWSMFFIWT